MPRVIQAASRALRYKVTLRAEANFLLTWFALAPAKSVVPRRGLSGHAGTRPKREWPTLHD